MDSKWLTPALCSALGGLHSLHSLALTVNRAPRELTAQRFLQLAAGIGQLQGLTRLTLYPAHPAGLQHLPASLRVLKLQRCMSLERSNTADLQHLTALQTLSVEPVMRGIKRALHARIKLQLPAQLSSLAVEGSVRLQGRCMPCMVKVELSRVTQHVADMLRDLGSQQDRPWRLEFGLTPATTVDQHTGAALASCTSLTSLMIHDAIGTVARVPWSKHVAPLRQLRRLQIVTNETNDQDRLMLTALTSLTGLVVWWATEFTAVSLACSLTGLRALKLYFNELQTATIVPPVARLTGLRHLHLACPRSGYEPKASRLFTPAVLSQLLPLTQLTYLRLPLSESVCPEQARQQFVGQMPRLSSTQTDWALDFDCPDD